MAKKGSGGDKEGVLRDERGRYLPGTVSPGGRPRGVRNKTNLAVVKWVAEFVNNNTSTLEEDFKKLKPKERFDVIISLMPYVTPKKSEQSIALEVEREELVNLEEGMRNINNLFEKGKDYVSFEEVEDKE